MKQNQFIFRTFILTMGFLLTAGLMTSCRRSSEVSVIAANESNGANKKPMNNPTPPKTNGITEIVPLDWSKVPTVTYCELIKNSAAYDRKFVRVRAIYFNAFERIYLYDETCKSGQPPTAPEKVPSETWAEWDQSLVSKGDSDEAKLNRQLNGFGRKDVTVVGVFNSTNKQGERDAPNLFGHLGCCRFQFSIVRAENVVVLDGEAAGVKNEYGKTVKFAPNKKIEFADFTLLFQKDFQLYVAIPQPGQKLPTYAFKIEKGNEVEMVFPNSDAADISPLKFEFGGKRFQLESGVSDKSGRLAKDELIVRKLD